MYHKRILHISYIFTLFTINEISFTFAATTEANTEVFTTNPPDTATTQANTEVFTTNPPDTDVMSSTDFPTTSSNVTGSATTMGPFSIECETNTCPYLRDHDVTPRCLKRQAPEGPSYVCECPNERGSDYGFTCQDRYRLDFFNTEDLLTCYGPQCITGSTASKNFPRAYSNRFGGMMTLVYVPGAFRFDLTFDEIFQIELFKDDLLVGPGLKPPFQQVPGPVEQKSNLKGADYFNGYTKPADFSVEGDTMWIWFGYDNSIAYKGFNLSWTAATIEVDCPNGALRKSLPDDSDQIVVRATLPETRYGVAEEYLTLETTFPLNEYLSLGTYDIEYSVSDNFGNSATCDHQLIVEDTTPPMIEECPEDYNLIGVCAAQDANLTEPIAFDNVDGEVIADMQAGPALHEGLNDVSYVFRDSSGNTAVCRVTVGIYCMPPTKEPPADFPLWVVFVGAAVAVLVLLLILAVFANMKLSAIKAAHQADLSFNPEEFTGHKPGAPLEEAPLSPGKEKIGMYEFQP